MRHSSLASVLTPAAMSDYAFVSGGSLKFKGGADTKKKKKKSHSSSDRSKIDSEIKLKDGGSGKGKERETLGSAEAHGSRSESHSRSPMPERREEPKMTEAERRFLEQQKKRRQERVKQTAKMTHKERVSEFNAKLDSLR
ncbi:hypothetical protein, variant [Cryptococcus amylolentus CBS 6039]|uniref:DUF1754-domain-containing protein n=1 Tax=Cryptococcus amylolentus CBS 6039 TaxID=1295533 RepID=A0A1E3HKG1_9TREE|nr:hypothetical protein, variant [Cryptococcus amylolentus CBS 6039]ODN76824.1 hypothetical protein, variant [Cryptococcus amylolentus CBS 6039]